MQKKKNLTENHSSAWEENLKKEQQKQNIKKYGIWAAVVAAFLVGLILLIKLAGSGGLSTGATPGVENANLPKVNSKDIFMQGKDEKVTLIEYGDLQCPACAQYNPIVNQAMHDYKGKVRFIFRFFPLTSVHKNAIISGQAAYAGWKLGKFNEMKDILFDEQASWENLDDPRDTFIGMARKIGLDETKFKEIMNSSEAKNRILDGEKESLGIGLNSTPSFFVGNMYVGPRSYDDFKKYLDDALANAK